jgi:hypothetical protein
MTSYRGSLIEVTRLSDGAVREIGFDASGDLDERTLIEFANENGPEDVFVNRIFNQKDALYYRKTRSDAREKPRIVDASGGEAVVEKESGKPVARFVQGSEQLIGPDLFARADSIYTYPYTVILTHRYNGPANQDTTLFATSNNGFKNGSIYAFAGATSSGTVHGWSGAASNYLNGQPFVFGINDSLKVLEGLFDPSRAQAQVQSAVGMRWVFSRGPVNEYNIGGYPGYGYIGSYFEEVMLIQAEQSRETADEKSLREKIEGLTKSYYGL